MNGILKKQAVIPRIDGILRDIGKLKKLSEVPFEKFKSPEEEFFSLSQFYLRQALEGVFHIGEHVLSRINGGRSVEYKEIAKKLGDFNVVDSVFAETKLMKMAGYRNRLTHFYASVAPEEIYEIINNDLGDFEVFLKAIKNLIDNPEKFGLKIGQ